MINMMDIYLSKVQDTDREFVETLSNYDIGTLRFARVLYKNGVNLEKLKM